MFHRWHEVLMLMFPYLQVNNFIPTKKKVWSDLFGSNFFTAPFFPFSNSLLACSSGLLKKKLTKLQMVSILSLERTRYVLEAFFVRCSPDCASIFCQIPCFWSSLWRSGNNTLECPPSNYLSDCG